MNCPEGYYCNHFVSEKGVFSPFEINPCPAGTYGNAPGLKYSSGANGCQPCPAGKYCLEGTDTNTKDLNECPKGHYCPLGTKYAIEFPCPAGTIRASTQGTIDTDCAACTAAQFCPEGSAAPSACPPGYVCDSSTLLGDDSMCHAGSYSKEGGARATANPCHACDAGAYCPPGSIYPTLCPVPIYYLIYTHFIY